MLRAVCPFLPLKASAQSSIFSNAFFLLNIHTRSHPETSRKARAKDLQHLCRRICYTAAAKQPEQESRSSKTPNCRRLALLSFLRIIPYTASTSKENHRLVKVGKDLWMSSFPTPLLKQCHLQPVAQDCI